MSDYEDLSGYTGHARQMEIRRRTVVRKWIVKKVWRHETSHVFEVEATEQDIQNVAYGLECDEDSLVGEDGYFDDVISIEEVTE